MLLLGLFGVLGIVIACVGIYGVMAYMVTLRTQEIGIRMALGADARDDSAIGARTRAAYLGAGSAWHRIAAARGCSASLVSRASSSRSSRTTFRLRGVAVLLVGTGLLAPRLPARRASRVDPLTALRLE